MRKVFFFIFLLIAYNSFSQSVYPIRADTVRIYKQGGYAELRLENSTKDSTGALTNIGGGRTRFMRARVLNDSTFIVGLDTLVLRGASGGSGSTETLSNVGGGAELVKALSGSNYPVRTMANGLYIIWTQGTNTLRADLDTASMPKDTLLGEWGVNVSKVGGQITHEADSSEVSTRWADFNIYYFNLNGKPLMVQEKNPGASLGYADGVTAVRLSNGKIFCIYGRAPSGEDFANYTFYSATIDSLNAVTQNGTLFTGGFISEGSMINPSAYIMPNGNIGLIFQGFNNEDDVTLYFTQSSDNGETWAAPTALFDDDDFGHFFIVNINRVRKSPNGTYYAPIAVNTDDVVSTITGTWQGRYAYSTNGSTWTLASTVFNSPDNACLEPAIYFTTDKVYQPDAVSTDMAVYCWRSRSNTILYKDSVFGESWRATALAMGLEAPNAPYDITEYKRKVIVTFNQKLKDVAGNERNKLVVAVSNQGQNDFKIVNTIYRDLTDTLTPYGPSLFIDTANDNMIVFYTKLQSSTAYGDLEVVRMNRNYLQGGTQEYDPFYSTIKIGGGVRLPFGTADLGTQLRIFDKTAGESSTVGWFGIGDAAYNDFGAFVPQINSSASTSYNTGVQWNARVGGDAISSPYSNAVTINALNSSGGALTTARPFGVLNNSSVMFLVKYDGTVRIAGGTPGAGKVLTSADSDGNATWETPASGGYWNGNANGIDYTAGNVGIGINLPTAPLHVYTSTSGVNPDFLLSGNNGTLGSAWYHVWRSGAANNKVHAWAADGNGYGYYRVSDDGGTILNSGIPDFIFNPSGFIGLNMTNPGGVLSLKARGNTSSDIAMQILDNSANYIMKQTGDKVTEYYGVTKYNADYSASMSTDRHIPDIGWINTNKANIASPTFTGTVTTPLIKITSGSPGAGKVLTSDADGDATWETPAAFTPIYATYSLAADKTFSSSATAEVITLDTEVEENGITHTGSSEEITFPTNGVYNVSSDIQAFSSAQDVVKWSIQKWDGDSWELVSNTGNLVTIAATGLTFGGSQSFQLSLVAGDKIRFIATATSTNATLNAIAAADGAAAVPAFRVRINKIANYNP